MRLRLTSGSLDARRAPRRSGRRRRSCECRGRGARATSSTIARSPARSSPVSTKMQVRRSPIARCRSAAATVESTPPDSAQITRPAGACSRIRATALSMNESGVQSGLAPQTAEQEVRAGSRLPRSVCTTSGWNCTPKSRRVGSRNAWIGAFALRASSVQPAGSDSMPIAVRHPDRESRSPTGKPRNRSRVVEDRDRRPPVLAALGARDRGTAATLSAPMP